MPGDEHWHQSIPSGHIPGRQCRHLSRGENLSMGSKWRTFVWTMFPRGCEDSEICGSRYWLRLVDSNLKLTFKFLLDSAKLTQVIPKGSARRHLKYHLSQLFWSWSSSSTSAARIVRGELSYG